MRFMKFISIGYEDIKYLINRFVLQEWGDFTWKVSECAEFSGDSLRKRRKILHESHFFGSMANKCLK